jgi:hypothetical protein
MEGVYGFLQTEAVSDQRFDVDETTGDQADGLGILIGVAELERYINLVGAEVHERERLLVLSHPDDKQLGSEGERVCCCVHTALNTGTLQRDAEGHASELLDLLRLLLFSNPSLDEEGLHTGNELFGEVQTTLEEVGNDDGLGSCSSSGQERDETDGTSTTDEERISQAEARSLDTGKRHSKGLTKSAFFKGDVVWKTVQPLCWLDVPSRESSMVGRRGEEDHVGAAIVFTSPAGIAGRLRARDTDLHRHAIACFPLSDTFTYFNDFTRGFVARSALVSDNHRVSDTSVFPEMHVTSTDTGRSNVKQYLTWPRLRARLLYKVDLFVLVVEGRDVSIRSWLLSFCEDTKLWVIQDLSRVVDSRVGQCASLGHGG